MTDCYSEEQLAGYLAGDCTVQETAAIRGHLKDCATCQAWVDDAGGDDVLLNSLRRVMDEDSGGLTQTVGIRLALDEVLPRHAIEGYDIQEELGRGGMGVVYRAVQLSTKRQVALKVLLEGPFASKASKRRFEREVELAAQLDHPHIVAILESGSRDGRHYFAMRYVAGRRLDEYVVGKEQSLKDRLALFVKICDAVNYAHQRGVIHRDLKPSNILIDANGEPHILDFGLAKPTDVGSEDETQPMVLSVTGQVMGTLPYMSPEQAAGTPNEVDIRTDVYSLGVILYEMLTGRYPYPVVGQVADVLRNIAEAEPRRPSTILRMINNEVETIVLKALSKVKDRRYQSAENLARDVERYLTGRAIEAKRDSGWYVLRKTVRRYRTVMSISAATVIIGLTGLYYEIGQRTRLQHGEANRILAEFVHSPGEGSAEARQANAGVRAPLRAMAEMALRSPAFTERVMGSRAGLFVAPEAFWNSVDGGPLWTGGEWMELCRMEPAVSGEFMTALAKKVVSGSDREKYVALCLIGQLGSAETSLAAVCETAGRTNSAPGVVAAAHWAAKRLGREIPYRSGEETIVDHASRMTFVRVPGSDGFRRGSPASEPDRVNDEDSPSEAMSISAFYLTTTEVTLSAFEPFLKDPASRGMIDDLAAQQVRDALASTMPEEAGRIAANWISLQTARAFCNWLNGKASESGTNRRYRLPTEEEWEFACRAGNSGRFCFGDDADYATYFANCQQVTTVHRVGERMPNWYGVFDMHGGLWERCESRYPAEFVDDPSHAAKELWVSRGGAFYSPAVRCRSAQRNYNTADAATQYSGFRLVMELESP